jgi:hypothetical protein
LEQGLIFYINEYVVARTYYRYYEDDWGIKAHCINRTTNKNKFKILLHIRYIDIIRKPHPIILQLMNSIFLLRNIILDYDLSKFDSNQYGLGFTYTDIFTQAKNFILD